MTKQNDKNKKILQVATQLLKSEGDMGLTMRKVATSAGMSLSNVQYYYTNKNVLLQAIADQYFDECVTQLKQQTPLESFEELHLFIISQLNYARELSDMCRIFREYWAISTRNDAINEYLRRYYETVYTVICDVLRPLSRDDCTLKKSAALLVSFVEGYSITGKFMPVDTESIASTLVEAARGSLTK
ncbi:Nucleoid occlusion factor SlmA [Pseudoalteromonas sp. P1-9]|uniref:TetR/AcrR family transcriptional regulator n=1 Tax=Pseudoalteromonas sp. P1-9 TaxID=1710354 RepID=UPI0006D64CCD|nr:TetR/AcrR family transcriptional regulator [Pseudoalteromonas sp. P1-9]KPV95261.1 Nucleoid occlusion factor SlmA [Pseudoalteromonas sp. P1-9]